MKYVIIGHVVETESQHGVPGVVVSAFDKDLIFDDMLGEVMTDADGAFHIEYVEGTFSKLFESVPDIYRSGLTPHRAKSSRLKSSRKSCGPRDSYPESHAQLSLKKR
jgi:hypothetical protein